MPQPPSLSLPHKGGGKAVERIIAQVGMRPHRRLAFGIAKRPRTDRRRRSPPVPSPLVGEGQGGGSIWRGPMLQQRPKNDLALGPIGNRVIFENEQVRVWELAVEPGKSKGLHRHDLPYVIVPLTEGKIEIESIDGKVYRPQEKLGEAIWRDAGEIHDLRNLGTATYRNVLVEIKSTRVANSE